MPDIYVREYSPAGHLGRHQVLDPRSLAYRRPYDGGQPLRATAWEPRLPVLDQRNLLAQGIHTADAYGLESDTDALASCTGNAATALLSILLTPEQAHAAALNLNDPAMAEHFAIGLYADATACDQWSELAWPDQDVGSSGLGVAKALRNRGLIDQYGHATTAAELCALLQTGPVLLGMPWHAAFSDPDPDGFIDADPAWADSPLEGGHEVCVTALEAVAFDDGTLMPEHSILRFRQSWGSGWGDHGDGRLYLSTYLALRDQVDVIQPRIDSWSI
ncbi:hypothetical protein [Streptomyces rubiginosohelvolus]|uniref:Peptidase C1A papain C-terminal domain-containing protein n=1 Tax=Streptomyces rubiginosohelvolus TaxID=67362 RepID=A0ABQ3CBQ8_9ACTN|nr:hypothetical protein [Streptomyces pluricolorescens]GGZ82194.1 hypothetical protein GCM10010328_65880 [Streptomyces pluricolorescens]